MRVVISLKQARKHGRRWLLVAASVISFCCGPALGQANFETIWSLGFLDQMGELPYATPIRGRDGVLYGTAGGGGVANRGTVFKINPDGSGYTVLHHFAMLPWDGETPTAPVIEATDGALYGTTFWGGSYNCGVVFKLNKDGTGYTVLHDFGNGPSDAGKPWAGLLEGTDGVLYGTSRSGGAANRGAVFRLNKDGTSCTVLHGFGFNVDGWDPVAALVEGADGALYGTTTAGGTNYSGIVFRITKNGSDYRILHSFAGTPGDGQEPYAGLLRGHPGALYGTTRLGGSNNLGTVFRISEDGSSYTMLHEFTAPGQAGQYPQSPLIADTNGVLYGMTYRGGTNGQGTIFQVNNDGSGHAVLHHFVTGKGDAVVPEPCLLEQDGFLYGTTRLGGDSDRGLFFRLSKAAGVYTALRSFNATGGDGCYPQPELIEGSDGCLYGTAVNGGTYDGGVVFRQSRDGRSHVVLHHFARRGDGYSPWGSVAEGRDGALYGVTQRGGVADQGVVFKLNRDGTDYAILFNFSTNAADGQRPMAGLIQGRDGVLYGRTIAGGAAGGGVIFKVNNNGTGYTVLHSFSVKLVYEADTYSNLIEGSDGALYGTTYADGQFGGGSVFMINKDGTGFVSLRDFADTGPDARYPYGCVSEGRDGMLYGAGSEGGAFDWGALFKLHRDGSGYTVLYSFSPDNGGPYLPTAPPIEGPGGLLYGTTYYGGLNESGTVYKINKDGTSFAVLHRFDDTLGEGWCPYANLIKASDGGLYGTTFGGGRANFGTIYRVMPVALVGRMSAAGFTVTLEGFSGQRYAVDAAERLLSSWSEIGIVTNVTGAVEFQDPRPGAAHRFYRSRVLSP